MTKKFLKKEKKESFGQKVVNFVLTIVLACAISSQMCTAANNNLRLAQVSDAHFSSFEGNTSYKMLKNSGEILDDVISQINTSGAYYFSRLNRMMVAAGVEEITYENDIPKVQYTTQVDVTGYFNDAYSDVALLRMYEQAGVKKIGFWRVGQEDPEFWNWLKVSKNK